MRYMPLHQFIRNVALLIAGGSNTTRVFLTGELLTLSQNPNEYRKLHAQPDLVKKTVSEIIRCMAPAIHMRRTSSRTLNCLVRRSRRATR